MKYVSFKGTIKRMVYEAGTNPFRVASIEVSEMSAKVGRLQKWKLAGTFPGDVGDTLSGTAEVTYDPVYGYGLKAMKVEVTETSLDSDDSFRTFLIYNINGIGPTTADNLLSTFGREHLVELLDRASEDLRTVPGIGEATLNKILESWGEHRLRHVIWPKVSDLGFGRILTERIIDKFGKETEDVITKHPYRLCEITGISFARADKIAMENLSIPELDPVRLQTGIFYILRESQTGNTYMPKPILKDQLQILLSLDELSDKLYDEALLKLLNKGKIMIEWDRVFLTSTYMQEKYIGRKLVTMRYSKGKKIDRAMVEDFINLYQQRNGIKFTDTQKTAIYRCSQENTMVITGGPGSGKTTTLGAVHSMFVNFGFGVRMCAPTGRAARRMRESTGGVSETIHRLLGPYFKPNKGLAFHYNASNPLDADVVIVDEVSMVDVALMSSLLRAIKPEAKIIMVGDKDQLPSIGAGNVLQDILASGRIPSINLLTIFRQAKASKIVSNALRINQGNTEIESGGEGSDFYWTRKVNMNNLITLVTDRIPKQFGYDISEIKVITPFRREMVAINATSVNRALQDRVNPERKIKDEFGRIRSNSITYNDKVFRVGDPVMQLRNDDAKMVCNGDIGTVHSVDKDEAGRVSMVVDFEDPIGKVAYTMKDIGYLDLAYSMTVHKVQGSEFEAVIVAIPTEYKLTGSMLKRNLLYTAVTRAKKLCLIMSSDGSLKRAIKDNSYAERLTMLQDWIHQEDKRHHRLKKRSAA